LIAREYSLEGIRERADGNTRCALGKLGNLRRGRQCIYPAIRLPCRHLHFVSEAWRKADILSHTLLESISRHSIASTFTIFSLVIFNYVGLLMFGIVGIFVVGNIVQNNYHSMVQRGKLARASASLSYHSRVPDRDNQRLFIVNGGAVGTINAVCPITSIIVVGVLVQNNWNSIIPDCANQKFFIVSEGAVGTLSAVSLITGILVLGTVCTVVLNDLILLLLPNHSSLSHSHIPTLHFRTVRVTLFSRLKSFHLEPAYMDPKHIAHNVIVSIVLHGNLFVLGAPLSCDDLVRFVKWLLMRLTAFFVKT
jgi:hypothetical protein